MVRILASLILLLGIAFAQPMNKPCRDNNKCDDCKTDKTECIKTSTDAHRTDAKDVCYENKKQTSCKPAMPSCADRCEIAIKENPANYRDMECKQDPKEMVETIRIYKITEELDLTQDQSVKFFPKLKEMRDAREVYNAIKMTIGERLNSYLENPDKFKNEIKSLVGELEANETKMRESENRIKKEISNILTPEQQAKFLLFSMKFNQEMREMVGKARDMQRDMQRPPEVPAPPKLWRF